IGPVSGAGWVMTGVYVAKIGPSASISGFFVAAGAAHIACFGIAACLLVSVEQQHGDMVGSATYTFTFSLGITDISFSVGVSHTIGKGFSSGGGEGGPPPSRDSNPPDQGPRRFSYLSRAAVQALSAAVPAEAATIQQVLGRPRIGSPPPVYVESEVVAMDDD